MNNRNALDKTPKKHDHTALSYIFQGYTVMLPQTFEMGDLNRNYRDARNKLRRGYLMMIECYREVLFPRSDVWKKGRT